MPTYTYNAQPYADTGPAVPWSKGARLTMAGCDYPEAFYDRNGDSRDGAQVAPRDGVYDLGTFPGPGTYDVRVLDTRAAKAGFPRRHEFRVVLTVPEVVIVERPVPVADVAEARKAIANGARHLLTANLKITDAFDARGATIEMLPGTPKWLPLIDLDGAGAITNAMLVAIGRDAINTNGNACRVEDVTFAAGCNYAVKNKAGVVTVARSHATTFEGYFYFGDRNTDGTLDACTVTGGSQGESVIRCAGARTLTIRGGAYDNRGGGKAVLRGDCRGTTERPGWLVRDATFYGVIHPHPLGGGDGGMLMGVDRWRIDGAWIFQIPARVGGVDNPRIIVQQRIAADAIRAGKSPREIVRACASQLTPEELTSIKRPNGLTDRDIDQTLAHREMELSAASTFLVERITHYGEFTFGAGATGRVVNSTHEHTAGAFGSNSEPAYPPPAITFTPGEARTLPAYAFEDGKFVAPTLGVDLAKFPGVTFTRTTFNGRPMPTKAAR